MVMRKITETQTITKLVIKFRKKARKIESLKSKKSKCERT